MLKKIFTTIIFSVFCLISMTACIGDLSYYEKVDTAIILSDEIMKLYEENAVSVGSRITSDNVADYCTEDDEMYKILNSDNESQGYSVCVIADDKALVVTNVIFHSVEGYVVNFGEEELPENIEVPEQLGYDGNTISVVPLEEDYPNIYTFRAGL